MEKWMPVIVAVLGSGALSALITGIFASRSEKKKKEDAIQTGVRTIIYIWIKSLAKSYHDRGFITYDELEDIKIMHNIYHDKLKGNGFLDTVMKKLETLPVTNSLLNK